MTYKWKINCRNKKTNGNNLTKSQLKLVEHSKNKYWGVINLKTSLSIVGDQRDKSTQIP